MKKTEKQANALTAKDIGSALSRGDDSPWVDKDMTLLVRNLARPRAGDVRAYIQGQKIGSTELSTRAFAESQIVIALVHAIIRDIGKMPKELSEKVSLAMGDNGHFILGDDYEAQYLKGRVPKTDPAQRAIDLWRAGNRGFSFEINIFVKKATNNRDTYQEIQCGLACASFNDKPLSFNPMEPSLARISLPLDDHFNRIFGEAS